MERLPLSGRGLRSAEEGPAHHLQLESALDNEYPVYSPADRCWKASESYIKVALGVSLGIAVTLTVVLSVLLAPDPGSESITFLVVGDWGRQGKYNQSSVAQIMAARADSLQPEFVISTGDNFYPHGLNSTDDLLFDESFARMYTTKGLQVPWHAVLGNHDYGDGDYVNGAQSCLKDGYPCHVSPMHQLGSALIERDLRWHCERQYSLTLAGGFVEIFFLDTTPFVEKYRNTKTYEWAKYTGGVLQQSWEAQLREFEGQLAASTAPWKLVVGHHPPRSNGHHGDTLELIKYVEPLLTQYAVQAYFAGHDHSLEHLYVPQARYHIVVSGAGSKCDRKFQGVKMSKFQWPYSGFVAATLTNNELRVEYHHLESGGKAAYTAIIPRQMS